CFDDLFIFQALLYPEGNTAFSFCLNGDEFLQYFFSIKEVEYKNSVGFQRIMEHSESLNMFFFRLKVAETGEKVESVIKAIAAILFAHILDYELKTFILKLSCVSDAGFREVDASRCKTLVTHVFSMSSASAGDVKQSGMRLGMKMLEKIVYKCSRFLVIAIFV